MLRTDQDEFSIKPISPSMVVKGYDIKALNIIPELHVDLDEPPDWKSVNSINSLTKNYEKLQKTRNSLIKLYNQEFIIKLMDQAVDKNDRYKPTVHHIIKKNNIVHLKENYLKNFKYPMAIVKEVIKNSKGEVTACLVKKGNTGGISKRHVSVIIPLLSCEDSVVKQDTDNISTAVSPIRSNRKHYRKAALLSRQRSKFILND